MGENGFSKNEGFTLIELMVVIAVVAIITSFALPSYRMLIEKRQVTSGAEQLAAFISSAQIEAVKRSNNVSVSYTTSDSDTWCVGMVVGLTACDCQETDPTSTSPLACAIDTQLRVYTDAMVTYSDILQSMTGDGSFVYDPARGMMVTVPDPVELKLQSEEGTYALNVQVNVTGRVKICNDVSANTQVPGFKQC